MAVAQKSSLSSIATDPLRNFRFVVNFRPTGANVVPAGFMSVSGLSMTIDVIPYREGGFNTTTQKMPGQADFNPITFSKGVIVGKSQFDIGWIQELFTVIQGTGNAAPSADFRMNVDIEVLNHPARIGSDVPVKALFRVYNAWPTAIAWSDLDAGANQLLVEQMSIAHEGFDVKIAEGAGQAEAQL